MVMSLLLVLLLLLLLFELFDGGGAYLGVLGWKKDRIDICDGLLVVGSDMAGRYSTMAEDEIEVACGG